MKDATTYRVYFFGFGREQDVAEDKLSTVPPISSDCLPPSSVQEGLECEAKYYVDGEWYSAKVTKVVEDEQEGKSIRVNFTLYGNTEEVPVEWLRIKKVIKVAAHQSDSSKSATATDGSSKKDKHTKYKPVSQPKILVVPDHLRAKDGDTDKERKNKRKRMRSIQNKNRFAKKEIESNNKQASWQNFQTKATKKLKRGVTGDSQFSTSGIGGRVGVTGSQNRKKGTIGGPRR